MVNKGRVSFCSSHVEVWLLIQGAVTTNQGYHLSTEIRYMYMTNMGALSWINAETLQSSAERLPPRSTTIMSVPRDMTYNTDITYSSACIWGTDRMCPHWFQ